ncbi:MAG: DcaP family trimeric outer membrane transporter [Pseudomonadota bacterium]
MLSCAASITTASAQSQDDEVKALRKEVAELRELVDALLRANDGSPPATGVADPKIEVVDGTEKSRQQLEIRTGTQLSEAETNPKADEETNSDEGFLETVLSSRQPIGRFPDDAYVTSGSFDRSITVPGTPGSFRMGGSIQVNANFDPDNQGFQFIGTPPTIPLDGDVDDGSDQFLIHTRLTRVNFDYRAPTRFGQFRTFVEFDFFGDGDQFTNDFDLRLRHAYAELGPWKFGQSWSGFTDVFSLPETADPGGPLAAPALRQPGFYYVKGPIDGSNWGIGIENPAADLGGNEDLIASESIPTVVGFKRISGDWGYVRFSGIGLQLKSDFDSDFTGGAQITGRLYTPFTGSDLNNITFGGVYGAGFTHYYSSFVGGLGGIVAEDGEVDATDIRGAYLGYQHFWTDRWRSTLTASFFDLDQAAGAGLESFDNSERYSVNLFYTPIDGATFGLEGIFNNIETFDGSEGEGVRIEFVGRFDF